MRKLIIGAAAILLFAASCSYKVYPVETLLNDFNLAALTGAELAAKENVAIFLSENDVPGPYKLVALVDQPGLFPVASQDVLKKAVLKADELGGNAVIVYSPRSFKVISLPERTRKQLPGMKAKPAAPQEHPAPAARPAQQTQERPVREKTGPSIVDKVKNAEIFKRREPSPKAEPAPKQQAAPKAEPAPKPQAAPKQETKVVSAPVEKTSVTNSPIFDEATSQWFTSGYVYRAKEQEQTEIIEAMNSEIRENLKICKTAEEAACIATKIDLLEKYNQALPIPSGTQANKIKAYRNTLKKLSSKWGSAQESATGVVGGAVQSVKDFFGNLKK